MLLSPTLPVKTANAKQLLRNTKSILFPTILRLSNANAKQV